MSKPIPEVHVTYWLNLYQMKRTSTIYAESFVAKGLADRSHEDRHLLFDRPRLGNKAHEVTFWEAEDGV